MTLAGDRAGTRGRRLLRWAIGGAVAGLTALLAAGYLGAAHPAGDSFAVGRAQGAAGLALLAGLCWAVGLRGLAGVALVVALGTGGPVLWAYRVAGQAGGYTLYQKNMLWRNDDLAGLEADIRMVGPDVLTLEEVSGPNRGILLRLADILPGQVFCPFASVGGVAVATRWPVVAGSLTCAPGLAALQAEGPEGRVWLVALHLHWPWPYGQAAHLEALLPVLQRLDGPVLLAGDFNAVPWSAAVGRVAAAVRGQLAGPVRGTFPQFGPLLVLPIDHVIGPVGGRVELRPLQGSDHRGLVARLGF